MLESAHLNFPWPTRLTWVSAVESFFQAWEYITKMLSQRSLELPAL